MQEQSSTIEESSRAQSSVIEEIRESASAIQQSTSEVQQSSLVVKESSSSAIVEEASSSAIVEESSSSAIIEESSSSSEVVKESSSSVQASEIQESNVVSKSSSSVEEVAQTFVDEVIASAKQVFEETPVAVIQTEEAPPIDEAPPAVSPIDTSCEDSSQLNDSLQQFADELQPEDDKMNQVANEDDSTPNTPGPKVISESKSEEKSETIETKEEDVDGGHVKETEFRTQSASDYAKTEISEDGTTQITKEQQVQSVRVVREVTVTEKEFGRLDELLEERMRLIPGAPEMTKTTVTSEPAQQSEPEPQDIVVTIEPGIEERAIDVPSEATAEVFEDAVDGVKEEVKGEEIEDDDNKSEDQLESPKSGGKKEKGGFFSFFKRKTHKSSTSDTETSPKSPRKEPKSPKKDKKKKEKKGKKDKKDKTPEPDAKDKTPDREEQDATAEDGQKSPATGTVEESKPVEELGYPIQTEILVEKEVEEPQQQPIQVVHESSMMHDVLRTLPPGPEPPLETHDDLSIQVDHKELFVNTDAPRCFTLPVRGSKSKSKSNDVSTTTTAAPLNTAPAYDAPTRTSQMLAPINSSYNAGNEASDPNQRAGHFVVVAIDFGTTFSGYAFSFTRDPGSIHMMRKWEGGDAGLINQKTPTSLLLTPDGQFHSFGFRARDFYHDLDPKKADKWLYFEKFKMVLHYDAVSTLGWAGFQKGCSGGLDVVGSGSQ